jgi:hypothetical protein
MKMRSGRYKIINWALSFMTLKNHNDIWFVELCAELLHPVSHLQPEIDMLWYFLYCPDVQLVNMMVAMKSLFQTIIEISHSARRAKA